MKQYLGNDEHYVCTYSITTCCKQTNKEISLDKVTPLTAELVNHFEL